MAACQVLRPTECFDAFDNQNFAMKSSYPQKVMKRIDFEDQIPQKPVRPL